MCADILTVTIIVWEEVFKCKAAREWLLFPFNTKLAPVTVGNNLGNMKREIFYLLNYRFWLPRLPIDMNYVFKEMVMLTYLPVVFSGDMCTNLVHIS